MKIIAKVFNLIKIILKKIQDFIATDPIKEEIPQELYERWKTQFEKGTARKFIKDDKTKKFSLRELWEDYKEDK